MNNPDRQSFETNISTEIASLITRLGKLNDMLDTVYLEQSETLGEDDPRLGKIEQCSNKINSILAELTSDPKKLENISLEKLLDLNRTITQVIFTEPAVSKAVRVAEFQPDKFRRGNWITFAYGKKPGFIGNKETEKVKTSGTYLVGKVGETGGGAHILKRIKASFPVPECALFTQVDSLLEQEQKKNVIEITKMLQKAIELYPELYYQTTIEYIENGKADSSNIIAIDADGCSGKYVCVIVRVGQDSYIVKPLFPNKSIEIKTEDVSFDPQTNNLCFNFKEAEGTGHWISRSKKVKINSPKDIPGEISKSANPEIQALQEKIRKNLEDQEKAREEEGRRILQEAETEIQLPIQPRDIETVRLSGLLTYFISVEDGKITYTPHFTQKKPVMAYYGGKSVILEEEAEAFSKNDLLTVFPKLIKYFGPPTKVSFEKSGETRKFIRIEYSERDYSQKFDITKQLLENASDLQVEIEETSRDNSYKLNLTSEELISLMSPYKINPEDLSIRTSFYFSPATKFYKTGLDKVTSGGPYISMPSLSTDSFFESKRGSEALTKFLQEREDRIVFSTEAERKCHVLEENLPEFVERAKESAEKFQQFRPYCSNTPYDEITVKAVSDLTSYYYESDSEIGYGGGGEAWASGPSISKYKIIFPDGLTVDRGTFHSLYNDADKRSIIDEFLAEKITNAWYAFSSLSEGIQKRLDNSDDVYLRRSVEFIRKAIKNPNYVENPQLSERQAEVQIVMEGFNRYLAQLENILAEMKEYSPAVRKKALELNEKFKEAFEDDK